LNRDVPARYDDSSAPMESAVYVHVYDLDAVTSKYNSLAYHMGSGVFHVGVQIYNDEWSFGQHDDFCSGITCNKPKEHLFHIYRESLYQGDTDLSRAEVWLLLERMKPEWPGNSYHLFNRNCQSFADELCQELGVKPLPDWIMRLPKQGVVLAEGISSGVQTMREIDETLGVSSGMRHMRHGVRKGMSALGLQAPPRSPSQSSRDHSDSEEESQVGSSVPGGYRRNEYDIRRFSAPILDRPLGMNDVELIDRMSKSSDFIPLDPQTISKKRVDFKKSPGKGGYPMSDAGEDAPPLNSYRALTQEKEKERSRQLARGMEAHIFA